ncbi:MULTISPECIES: hypothetical protein [Vibrio]|uniref:hypothetical protein n=1 Tax=Vibrio TaxID=662 RepID=UPI00111CE506|nr:MULTISPECIES: hypothetical protein [Vibrio]EGR2699460.1 hypothetical protein [Vibrio parahaemolyticus]MBO0138629.1 hypothetical protein [Vibrio sp. Vb2736]TOB01656.1 hypothetical protein CGK14_20900 [Vibrio parahaemolyticus]WHP66733.1 hypothetical protein QMY49_26485 [Vibrio harveyi]
MTTLASLESTLNHDMAMRRFLDTLNRNEMERLSGEIDAKFYWNKRNPQWYSSDNARLFALLNRAKRIIKKRLKTGRVKPEQTEHGSIIERSHFPLGDTLTFWNCYLNDSWRIAHQDSSYSAFWYNERELKLCTYCEGDVVFMTAPNEEIYRKDYESLDAWYTDNL